MGRRGGQWDLSPPLWHLKGPHSSVLVCATPATGHTAPAPSSCSQACERSEVGKGRGSSWLQALGQRYCTSAWLVPRVLAACQQAPPSCPWSVAGAWGVTAELRHLWAA